MSLHDYVTSGVNTQLDNGQTRLLSGVGDSIPFGQCTHSLLTEAIANMDHHFSFVGLSEHFDESLVRMRAALKWKKRPFYAVRNRNKKRLPIEAIPDETIAAIKQHNDLDCRLYDHVKSRFEETRSPTVLQEVKQFQRVNLLYQMLRQPVDFCAFSIRRMFKS